MSQLYLNEEEAQLFATLKANAQSAAHKIKQGRPVVTLYDYCDAWQQCYFHNIALALVVINAHVSKGGNVHSSDGVSANYKDIISTPLGKQLKLRDKTIGAMVAVTTRVSNSIGGFVLMGVTTVDGAKCIHIDAQSVVALRMTLLSGNIYVDFAKYAQEGLKKYAGTSKLRLEFIGEVKAAPVVEPKHIVLDQDVLDHFFDSDYIEMKPLRNGIIMLGNSVH